MSPTQMGDKFRMLDSYVSKNNVYLKWRATSGPTGRAWSGLSVNCLCGQVRFPSVENDTCYFSWPHPPQVRRVTTLTFPWACSFMQNVTINAMTLRRWSVFHYCFCWRPCGWKGLKRCPYKPHCFIVSATGTDPCACDTLWLSSRRHVRSQWARRWSTC